MLFASPQANMAPKNSNPSKVAPSRSHYTVAENLIKRFARSSASHDRITMGSGRSALTASPPRTAAARAKPMAGQLFSGLGPAYARSTRQGYRQADVPG